MPENVLGVLSLIFWSLILVVSLKYLLFILRADNRGEGGILALMALIHPEHSPTPASPGRRRTILVMMGLFGAALLYGDGMITPAISVLSAVEGLRIATPVFEPYVIPITIVILIGLFPFQRRGTAGVGAVFGPVTLVWFGVLAVLGIRRHRPRPGGAGGAQSLARRALLPRTTTCTASWCSARCSWSSPAARRSTPTWATSARGRSA